MELSKKLDQLFEFKDNIMGKVFSLCKGTEDNSTKLDPSGDAELAQCDASLVRHQPLHSDAVNCLCSLGASPLCIASGSKDQYFSVLDLDSNLVLHKIFAHQREVTKIVYCSQKDAILTASRDKTIKLWSNKYTESLCVNAHNLIVTGLDVNSDGTQFVSGSRDNFMKLWDMNTGQCLRQSEISRNLISHVKWAPNSHLAVQSGEDKELRIWDTRTLSVAIVFPRKNYIQTQCDISGDSTQCLSTSNGFGGSGCEATLWDVRSRAPVFELTGHREAVGSCSFMEESGEPDLIATGAADATVRLWSRNSGAEVCCAELAGSGPVAAVLPLSGGRLAAATFHLGIQLLRHGPAGGEDLRPVAAY